MTSKRKGGLGRGLGSLIPTAPQASGGASPTSVSLPGVEALAEPAPETAAPETAAPEMEPTAEPVTEPATTDESPADSIDDGTASAGTAQGRDDAAGAASDGGSEPDGPELVHVEGATFLEIAVGDIHPNPKQPRQVFDEDALQELTHSIREFGVLQPVIVRSDPAGGYELVMGERRLRASIAAGLDRIPAIIRTTADDAMLRDALLENIHRAQLNPLEEAAAYQQLLEEFGATHEDLARRIGRSRPQVTNTIRLLNLSLPVQRRVAAGVLSAGHARALLSVDDTDVQDELAGRIVAEGLSVRATEELATLARGDGAAKSSRRASTPRATAPAAAELAGKLSDLFDTRVRVEIGRRKGRITVEFGSIDDLERIVAVMAPKLAVERD